MTVKEAKKYIDKIDNEVKNLQKLLSLSNEDISFIEEKANLNNTIKGMVNTSVNSMLSYKQILLDRIDNTEIKWYEDDYEKRRRKSLVE